MMTLGVTGLLVTTALLAVAVPGDASAQKADTVILINGDRISGAIKGVTRGKLSYDTDDAGLLGIEWDKVVVLISNRTFEITDQSGRRHVGPLRRPVKEGLLAIGDAPGDTLRIVKAVTMAELGARLAQRINAEVDVGFTYIGANNAATLSADGEAEYRGRDVGSSARYQIYQQRQENAPGILRWTASATASRYLRRDLWSLESVVAMQRNDELNLARRLLGGGGLGRWLRRSTSSEVQAILGMLVIQERFRVESATDVDRTSAEGALILKADVFRFDRPKVSATVELSSFKSFATAGRVRGDAVVDLRYTGMQDFSIGVRVQDVFDTRPPAADARKNDFQTNFTLGWTYRR